MSLTHTGGHPAARMQADQQAALDRHPTRTSCLLCDWTHTGTALEGRELAAQHRANDHPTVKSTRRRRTRLSRWTTGQDGYRETGLANAAEVRAMLERREREEATA